MKKSKISYVISDCGNRFQHKHAAVSDFSEGATICFNMSTLKDLPPSNLYSEIVGLLAHEYAHILGKSEAVANQVQALVVNNWINFKNDESTAKHMVLMEKLSDLMGSMASLWANFKDEDGRLYKSILYSSYYFSVDQRNMVYDTSTKVRNRKSLIQLSRQISEVARNLVKLKDGNIEEKREGIRKYFCEYLKVIPDLQNGLFLREWLSTPIAKKRGLEQVGSVTYKASDFEPNISCD